jgi:phage/plasmid-associated DNA primase
MQKRGAGGIIEGQMAKDEELILSDTEKKMTLKQRQAKTIADKYRIVRFRGAVLYRADEGWEPLSFDEFARICYKVHGAGIRQTQIKDLQHLFFTSSDDLTKYAHYIAMPDGRVWDMKQLDFTDAVAHEDCVYTTSVNPGTGHSHRQWLEEVTMGDKRLADDIIQALAPVFMHKKPFGVFWFLGNGANGKSTTLKALYAIFGSESPYTHNRWFSQLTVKQIEDERDTPMINGKLGNICLESNDGHVKDTGGYKNLAEHSTFNVHKFNSQDGVYVDGNVHTIFNANNIPTFADKTQGVRRRTFTIPFRALFPQDNTFDEKLFATEGFLPDLLAEILATAKKLAKRGCNYDFSIRTLKAKEDYDEEVNTAETYFEELTATDIWGFTNFTDLTKDYQRWCDERSYTALGKKSIAHAAKVAGYERKSFRQEDNKLVTRYVLDGHSPEELVELQQRWGMFQKEDSDIELSVNENTVDKTYDKLIKLL